MRSSYFVKAIMCIIIAAGFGSCRGVANKPKIIGVMKPEQESIKLIYQNRTRGNGIQLGFSGEEVSLNNPKLLAENEEELEYKLQKIEKPEDYVLPEGVSEANFFEVTPTKQMGIGEVLLLSGSASDKTNESLDFQVSFTTVNSKPARLKITELRPLASSKKNEFIEFIVEEDGNLFGIQLSNVGSKDDEQHHYTFPSAEVKKGERVVFHWWSIEEENKDEVDASIISGGSQACKNARDFWGNIQKRPPQRNPNVITVKNPSDNTIQDAVLYFNIRPKGKEKQKPEFKWTFPEIETAAKEAVAAGVWKMKGEAFCEEDFFCCNITPSASIGRSNDTGEWKVYTAKEVTMGEKNN
ncbi:MAG: hypothetical protein P1P67_02315 [Treponema phagedenis]|uniref:hypothetical protein n=1 Tax=Treponema phagedenis TaxID=162 RepID=UPI003133DC2F